MRHRTDFHIEPLSKMHDRETFSCGIEALDSYLKRQASQDVAKHTAVCFVLTPDGETVAGFYTVSQYAVDLARLPREIASKLPTYPEVPATLLCRLALSEVSGVKSSGSFSCWMPCTVAGYRASKSRLRR